MKIKIVLLVLLIASLSACNNKTTSNNSATEKDSTLTKQQQVIEYTKIWTTDTTLKIPESLKYDKERNCIYVANINGKSSEKDGNGFISKLDLEGNIKTLKWIDGLDAPKGMGIIGNSLFVTNINEVVEIDIENAQIIQKINIPEAQFLNDIDVDAENNKVYISDMATGKIHIIKNGNSSIFAQDTLLERVNGLCFHNNELLAGTKNGVYKFDNNGKPILFIAHQGSIDGLEYLDGNRFIVSNWSGAIHIIEPGKDAVLIFDTTNDKINAADIDYIAEKNILLVPTFMDNRAMAYKLKLK